jgi:hypothetical protein
MPTSLKKLFAQSGSQKHDGLTQGQREAIVDLLHYCMYADNLVALKEDQFINNVASTLSWDPNISFETYEGSSIGNARRAKEQSAYRVEFMNSVNSRLGETEVRRLAFDLVKQLFNADAELADQESQQLPIIRKALGL